MAIGKCYSLCLIFTAFFLTGCAGRIESAHVTPTNLPSGQASSPSTSAVQDVTATSFVAVDNPTVQVPTNTPIPTEAAVLSQLPACDDPSDTNLLSSPLSLQGTAENSAEPPQPYQALRPDTLIGKDVLKVVLDLHGKRYGAGQHYDESAIIIEQSSDNSNGTWKVVSIVWYKNDQGQDVNGVDGKQTIYIPLTDFIGLDQQGNVDNTRLNLEKPAGPLHFRFWNAEDFVVDIDSVIACNSQPGR
jgi:hypothetical protein